MRPLSPAIQTSEGRSLPWSNSRLVNLFAEASEGDPNNPFAVMAIPGLTLFSDVTTSPVRGLHRMGTVLYAVIGGALYSVSAAGVSSYIGDILGSLPVQMADNGTQLAIVGGAAGTTGYVFSGGVLTASPLNLPAVSSVTYIDGYFVWSAANSDQFIISALDDGLTYDPLDVATVEGNPDYIVGVVNDHRELQFYGTESTEVWYNSGAADFPFERQGNAFIERGCIDRDSIVKCDNSVLFVGNDRIVYRLDGYTPVRISKHSVEYRIAAASYYRAYTYTQEGHKFYALCTNLCTMVLDVATGLWHERQSYLLDTHKVNCAETAYGQTIMGDAYTGKLYTPSLDRYDENGDPIICIAEPPPFDQGRERRTLYAVELHAETGVGNGSVTNPQAIMQFSRDKSRTWSAEMPRSLGRIGEYLTRAVWRPNVQFRTLNLRFILPSSARRLVMGYFADIR